MWFKRTHDWGKCANSRMEGTSGSCFVSWSHVRDCRDSPGFLFRWLLSKWKKRIVPFILPFTPLRIVVTRPRLLYWTACCRDGILLRTFAVRSQYKINMCFRGLPVLYLSRRDSGLPEGPQRRVRQGLIQRFAPVWLGHFNGTRP